jgi:serine/threonine protein kinase/Tfp pilus assembly protein PilF
MSTKCPKCQAENPATSHFCAECGTQLAFVEGLSSITETYQAPLQELTTGSIFAGRYQIVEELGKGGMGKVYRAIDTKLKEEVALKLIKPEIASDRETIERFSNELKMARKIAHRNVGKMYELMEHERTHFITMEYVSGENLRSTIRRIGQLPVAKSIAIATQVCEGLAEAHRLGVVHRDLKPSNIMLDAEGNARILDFGIARSLKARGITAAGAMIGTPEYMSPEQAELKEVDLRSDIYSLGVVLYEMLTGRVPFEGETPLGIAMKHKSEIPKDPKEFNPQIPDALDRLVLKCLEKDRGKRYQDVGEILSELAAIGESLPITERIIPRKKPLTSKEITVTFGIKRLFIPALIIVALIAATVLLWQFLPRKEAVKSSIAVISFENQTGDKAYDYLQTAIPNLLITSLEQSRYLSVMTWERMHDLLRQKGKEDVEVIDKDLGFELCRIDGVDAIILGSFIKAGNIFATDVKVLDVVSKRIRKSASSKGEGVQSILEKQIGELSKEISRGIGVSDKKAEAVQAKIADMTTSSIDAYNLFLKGRDEFEKFYYGQALDSLKKAVELDPDFAVAHLYLARVLNVLYDTKESREAFEKAKALSQKTTEKERLYIEAFYATAVESDQEKRLRILKEIARKYPKEKQVHYELASYYGSRQMLDQGIQEYNRALELDPNFGSALNALAYVYSGMGNFEKAMEYFEKYAVLLPGDANPVDSMAELYFRMGKLDEAISKYKEALKLRPDFITSNIGLCYIYALKEDYEQALKFSEQFITIAPSLGAKGVGSYFKNFLLFWIGKRKQALSEIQTLIGLADIMGIKEASARMNLMTGLIYLDLGEFELSRKYLQTSYEARLAVNTLNTPDNKAILGFCFGLVDIKERHLNEARSRLAEVKSFLAHVNPANKTFISFLRDLLSAEILLAEGSMDKAISVMEKASPPEGPPNIQVIMGFNLPFIKDVLARAYKEKGQIDKAIAEYERLITVRPERGQWTLIHPRYHYELAKLYAEKGIKDKARERYQKFLKIWKDADPGILEVEDAKKRLANL